MRRRSSAAAVVVAAIAAAGCAGSEADTPQRAAPCDARPLRLDAAAPPAGATTRRLPGRPFDVVGDRSGRWAFASLPSTAGNPALAVLRRDGARLRLVRVVRLARDLQPLGLHLTNGGRLFVAAGAAVLGIDADALIRGGEIRPRRLAGGAGLIGVVATHDGRSVFATDESRAELVAVGVTGRVTRVPLAPGPVGAALSADERHLFVASEFDADWRDRGVLSVVDTRRALRGDPHALRASTPAGCHPVRVILDPARDVVWVSARESHAVLAFDAARLVTRPRESHLATVRVGPAPIDMALTADRRSLLVASSDRFSGKRGSLGIVDVRAALAGRDALAAAVKVGRFPRALATMPTRLLVANFGSRSIQALPITGRLR